jgi:hypothetical protein
MADLGKRRLIAALLGIEEPLQIKWVGHLPGSVAGRNESGNARPMPVGVRPSAPAAICF